MNDKTRTPEEMGYTTRGWFQRFDGEEYWVYGKHYLDGNGNDCITDGCTHWGVWPVEKKVNDEWVLNE